MPAVTSVTLYGVSRLLRTAVAVGGALARGFKRITRAFRHRRDAHVLARLDDRMLADIGITRSDLRDAYAEPLWHDPTDVLKRRADERRVSRRRAAFELSSDTAQPDGGDLHFPAANRPAQYLA
jgi:uncharacterized protein YjiS (DUF1127 family)